MIFGVCLDWFFLRGSNLLFGIFICLVLFFLHRRTTLNVFLGCVLVCLPSLAFFFCPPRLKSYLVLSSDISRSKVSLISADIYSVLLKLMSSPLFIKKKTQANLYYIPPMQIKALLTSNQKCLMFLCYIFTNLYVFPNVNVRG